MVWFPSILYVLLSFPAHAYRDRNPIWEYLLLGAMHRCKCRIWHPWKYCIKTAWNNFLSACLTCVHFCTWTWLDLRLSGYIIESSFFPTKKKKTCSRAFPDGDTLLVVVCILLVVRKPKGRKIQWMFKFWDCLGRNCKKERVRNAYSTALAEPASYAIRISCAWD